KIKESYKKIQGGLNTNSMTLFSGEIEYKLRQFRRICYYIICWIAVLGCCNRYCFYKPSGCIYTGDYDALDKTKWEELEKAYREYWEHIGCVQIPHHGSKNNFNQNFLKMNAFFIISAGYSNKYGHPHESV